MAKGGGDFTGGFKVELVGQGVGKHLRQRFRLPGGIQPADFKALGKNGLDRGGALDHVIQHNGHAVMAQLHAGGEVVHLVRPLVAEGDVDMAGMGQVHPGADNVLARQGFTLFQKDFFLNVFALAILEGVFIQAVAGNADAALRHQFIVARMDGENLQLGDLRQNGLGFLALGGVRGGNLHFNEVQVVLLLRADDDVIGPGAVKAFRQDDARLFHGLVRQRNGLAVIPEVRFHAQREGDAPGNVNAVLQALLEEGEEGEGRDADDEDRPGVALDPVLVGTQVPEKHAQQYQTADENEKRVAEEIVNKREGSGRSAGRG